jgi:putative ABC transport system substrate-binding protein
MQRRDFLTLLGGAAAAWPLAASAQQPDQRVRRICVLSSLAEDDPESVARRPAFEQALKVLNWTNGNNLRIDYRWAAGGMPSDTRKLVAEIIALEPDVILLSGTSVVAPVIEATRTIPIVFVQVIDPVGSGFIKSLARPGGNVTGFTQFEYSLAAKWVELLKEIAPHVTRAAVIRDHTRGYGIGQFAVVQAVAPSLGMELTPINALEVSEMESAIAEFARSPPTAGWWGQWAELHFIAMRSLPLRRSTDCPRSTPFATSSVAAV